MKARIEQHIFDALIRLQQSGAIDPEVAITRDQVVLERTKDVAHGEFASNIAMLLAKPLKRAPRDIASLICDTVMAAPETEAIEKIEVAGPGFINFFFSADVYRNNVVHILSAQDQYGHSTLGAAENILLEFVSANPTGPFHVGHGRGAAYGDALARLLRKAGYSVISEYYVNDAGRQMDILALSVWLRYLALFDASPLADFPKGAYQGDYVINIAEALRQQFDNRFMHTVTIEPNDDPDNQDTWLDNSVTLVKQAIGKEDFRLVFDFACDAVLDDMRDDFKGFGVHFDNWFSEHSLFDSGDIEKVIDYLKENHLIYEDQGALWFKATQFGDDKDRVVVRANGVYTYFASDMAYHYNKAKRADQLIDIFGADHHGYVERIKAAFVASGHNAEQLEIRIVQFAILYRGKEKVQMSTRSGEFVTLRELREEVGNDAARFFYVLRKPEQHMDFDLELAKSQSADNPVYYIQYAHARIASVFRQAQEQNLPTPQTQTPDYALLTEDDEIALMRLLAQFQETIERAALAREPHAVAYYLKDVATLFHGYYNAHPFLSSEANLRLARLGLISAVAIVIRNGLDILGVSAPENM